MPTLDPEIARSGAVGPQIGSDHCPRQEATFLQEFAHQFLRRGLIPLGLDQHVQDLSFSIDRSPEIDQASIDLRIDFVEIVMLCAASAGVCEDPPRSWVQND